MASDNVWDEPSLCPMQGKILRLLLDPNSPNAILAVYPTGSGKSHIIRTVGVIERGIVMVFIPFAYFVCRCDGEILIRFSVLRPREGISFR